MVDGSVEIFGEFRNGCDEKSVTTAPQLLSGGGAIFNNS